MGDRHSCWPNSYAFKCGAYYQRERGAFRLTVHYEHGGFQIRLMVPSQARFWVSHGQRTYAAMRADAADIWRNRFLHSAEAVSHHENCIVCGAAWCDSRDHFLLGELKSR